MNISPVNYNPQSFKHFGETEQKNPYSKKQRAVVAGMSALGTLASCAILAKRAGYSLNPSKMFKNIKNSYLAKVQYHDEQVIPIGVGSVLGGLAGGYMIDKDKRARKEKRREALMQIGNISIPILTVDFLSGKLEKYNLEITNIDKKATDTNKGMELKVTDDRLIELSGGIVQGTSGSPIIQDGKIIGAVTHVFVDDPTGGYGICIDEML